MAAGKIKKSGLAKRIQKSREGLCISAKELDRRSGLHVGHTAMIERGDRKTPSSDTVIKLAKALRVDIAWLLTGESYSDHSYQQWRSGTQEAVSEKS